MRETDHTGVALRLLREAADMTIRELAAEAGVSGSYLSRAETGQVTPSAKWVHLIASAVGRHTADRRRDLVTTGEAP